MGRIRDFFSGLTKKQAQRRARKMRRQRSKRVEFLLTDDDDVSFNVMEAFRSLKVAISVSIPKTGDSLGKAILLTSGCPEDGKTTVTVNLALMYAMSNAKVLLVDADIRKGRVARYFHKKSAPGLSDYLSGLVSLDEITHQAEQNENLSFITCGTHSPRPYELLESEEMKNLIAELRGKYDYIIIDTPPLLLVSDALAVVPNVDGSVLVCRHRETYVNDITRSLQKLEFSNAKILGVVVNDYSAYADMSYSKYDRYKYYQYAYSPHQQQ